MKQLGPFSNQSNHIEGVIALPADATMAIGSTAANTSGAPAAMGLQGGELVLVAVPDETLGHVPQGVIFYGSVVSIAGTSPLQTIIFVYATNCSGAQVNFLGYDCRYVVIPKEGTVSPP